MPQATRKMIVETFRTTPGLKRKVSAESRRIQRPRSWIYRVAVLNYLAAPDRQGDAPTEMPQAEPAQTGAAR